jgi:hypothetical protein
MILVTGVPQVYELAMVTGLLLLLRRRLVIDKPRVQGDLLAKKEPPMAACVLNPHRFVSGCLCANS